MCRSERPRRHCCCVWAHGSHVLQPVWVRGGDTARLQCGHSLLCHCRSPAVPPSSPGAEGLRRSAAWFGVTKRYRPLTAAGTPGSPRLCHPGLALFPLIAVPPRGCAGRSGLRPLAAPPSQGSPHRDRAVSPSLFNPASGWALGPGMVFACRAQQRLSHPSDINSSEQNSTGTTEVLLRIRARGLTPFPQHHLSRQLWYFGKGQCRAG